MIKLPVIISDGMIIEKRARIWGKTEPWATVDITFAGGSYEAISDATGHFEAFIETKDFGGPHELKIGDKIIRDVMVGCVWLCGGQSNMELPISRVRRRFEQELRNVNCPGVRAFTIGKAYDFTGEKPLDEGIWRYAVNDNIDSFFATSYFFASKLFERYGIPIGLINAAAGGSTAEAWMSEKALRKFPMYSAMLEKYRNPGIVRDTERRDLQNINRWYERLDEEDAGKKEGWESDEYSDASWPERDLTESWDGDLGNNGAVWFRKAVEIPEDMAGKPSTLILGVVVDSNYVYINGEFVGRIEYRYPPSIFDLPAGLLRAGRNLIAVRVISAKGIGGFVKDKEYKLDCGGCSIELTDKWKYRVGCVIPPMPETTFFYKLPVGLYNAMLSPVIGYSISGAIWYQGESNTDNPGEYFSLMQALIEDWRTAWGEDFPFIFTQLTNYDPSPADKLHCNWAELREQQLKCLAISNTAMAVTIDCGEYNDLHPLDKKTVGERLALAAQKLAYGEDIAYSGPIAISAKNVGGKIIISFKYADNGLKAVGGLPGVFELETAEGVFINASAEIEGAAVIVDCGSVRYPKSVRYAWADNPSRANLYNSEGLPASPFRIELG